MQPMALTAQIKQIQPQLRHRRRFALWQVHVQPVPQSITQPHKPAPGFHQGAQIVIGKISPRNL